MFCLFFEIVYMNYDVERRFNLTYYCFYLLSLFAYLYIYFKERV